MSDQDIALMAHLMRRAGFGATRDELEARVDVGYEATVEELLSTEVQEELNRDEMQRFHPWTWRPGTLPGMGAAEWLHDLVNTKRPLEEKMSLFWHGIFATGVSKVDHYDDVMDMIVKFRKKGLGDFRELLLEMAKDPAMIYWLDNNDNHADAVNENWGRELLELFSMGVGNYTEDDVRDCSRAFTGWTIEPKLPRGPIGRHDWFFEYREEDHDDSDKTFLGHTGNHNGDDIIKFITDDPACARFIARHLYSFFVADEVQVPAWSVTPPRDPEAVALLANTLINNGYDIRPAPGIGDLSRQPNYMGQDLLNPPSVEGWHTGAEWINSGSLMRRVNFTAELVGDVTRPGIRNIVDRMIAKGDTSPEAVVEGALDLMGPLEVNPESHVELVGFVSEGGDFSWKSADDIEKSTVRVSELMQLIVSLREYQYA